MSRVWASLLLVLALHLPVVSSLRAGASRVDITPDGEGGYPPLAGFNHGERRVKDWPVPYLLNFTSFMNPALGVLSGPLYVRALMLADASDSRVLMLTIDSIGSSLEVLRQAYVLAAAQGLEVGWDSVLITASHSHSCPGASTPYFLFAMAPATDLLVPAVRDTLVARVAQAMVEAQEALAPAVLDAASLYVVNVTRNRRAGKGILTAGSIDPHLGVLGVYSAAAPRQLLAVTWNFAWHGVCYGPANMLFSGDIMGRVNELLEAQFPGAVALFQQADAGDIDPAGGMCDNKPDFVGSHIVAGKVAAQLQEMLGTATGDVAVTTASQDFDMGRGDLNYTLARFNNCTHGGFLDMCTVCRLLRCDLNARFNAGWLPTLAKYSAVRLDIGVPAKSVAFVTLPGEPLLELGWIVRNTTQALGFNLTFLLGYSNEHQGYFATPDQYDIGGYESQMTAWGYDTALIVADHVRSVAQRVAPSRKTLKSFIA